MDSQPETPPAWSLDRRWLWITRFAVIGSLVLICCNAPIVESPGWFEMAVAWAVLLSIPHATVLLLLFSRTPQGIKGALGLAAVLALLTFLTGVLAVAAILPDLSWALALRAALTIVQAVLLGSAVKTWSSVEDATVEKKSNVGRIAAMVAGSLVYLLFLSVQLPNVMDNPILGREAAVTATLRVLNQSEQAYSGTYESGYTAGLHQLGSKGGPVSSENADLVDAVLSGHGERGTNNSFEKTGYKLTYVPDARDDKGHINGYTIIARPLSYKKSGERSFFTDASAVIRATSKDRDASVQDPPI